MGSPRFQRDLLLPVDIGTRYLDRSSNHMAHAVSMLDAPNGRADGQTNLGKSESTSLSITNNNKFGSSYLGEHVERYINA